MSELQYYQAVQICVGCELAMGDALEWEDADRFIVRPSSGQLDLIIGCYCPSPFNITAASEDGYRGIFMQTYKNLVRPDL